MIKIKRFLLKDIKGKKGNLLKFVSRKDKFFKKFGEIYFSEVRPEKFKGWKYHEKRTQIITVVFGKVRFFLKKKMTNKPKVVDIGFPSKLRFEETVMKQEMKTIADDVVVKAVGNVQTFCGQAWLNKCCHTENNDTQTSHPLHPCP